MGLMHDHVAIKYKNNYIEVDTRVLGFSNKAKYELIVNNEKVDSIEGTYGKFNLRSHILDQNGIK